MSDELQIEPDVAAAVMQGRKVEAIKLLRNHRGIGLKQAKDIVDDYSVSQGLQSTRSDNNPITGLVVLALLAFIAYALFAVINN